MKWFLKIAILLSIILPYNIFAQTSVSLKGVILDEDSITPLPFVYVINATTGQGDMSDYNGKFSIVANENDTLFFSFVGYLKLKVAVSKVIKTTTDETKKVYMRRVMYALNTVTVNAFKLKPYERDYMKKVIESSKMPTINVIQSPITALYMQFSKKGKEQRKLAQIFEELFIKEAVEKKINAQILRTLTGDETIDVEVFRKYCYSLSDDYILANDGYDLYSKVMECYFRWKEEKGSNR